MVTIITPKKFQHFYKMVQQVTVLNICDLFYLFILNITIISTKFKYKVLL